MRFRYIFAAALLLAVGIIAGCGGGTGEAPSPTQRLQGEWVGTINDPTRPDAAKCMLIISGSDVEGEVQSEDGTVIGTIHGTIDEEGNIEVEFEYEGESEGENGTIRIDDETGEVDIDIGDHDGGTGDDGEEGSVGDAGGSGQRHEADAPPAIREITLRRK